MSLTVVAMKFFGSWWYQLYKGDCYHVIRVSFLFLEDGETI